MRLFRDHGFSVDAVDDVSHGLDQLREYQHASASIDVIALGWPKYPTPKDEALLSYLDQGEFFDYPVIILSDEAEPRIQAWVSRRPCATLIFWNNYTDAVIYLPKMLSQTKRGAGSKVVVVPLHDVFRILFVDDSQSVRTYYQRLLSRSGYYVDTASNVNMALEKARSQIFDIAIIDYFMPGANGDVLCRALRDDLKTTEIATAIFTGTYSDTVIKEALDAGAVECMFKNEANELFLARIAAMGKLIMARKSIESERKRLESILSSVGDGVYGVNMEGKISFMNPAAKRILGFSADEVVVDKSPHLAFHYAHADGAPKDIKSCQLQKAFTNGEELRGWETVFWHTSAKAIAVECTVYPLWIDKQRKGSVVAFRDISERKNMENRLRWQATHDSLTELHNRRYLEDQLQHEVSRLRRSGEVSALLYIDLDRFKYINDTAGHVAGDKLLIEVGEQLGKRLRNSDILARLGGDEFAVILRNIDSLQIAHVADGFRDMLNQFTFVYAAKKYKINGSIGVALIAKDSTSAGEVLANADIACHMAKTKGRNQTHVYANSSDEKAAMDIELGWSERLREALQQDQFVLNYQPIIKLADLDFDQLPKDQGELWNQIKNMDMPKHYEVLVRLPGKNGELISPLSFIPTAERFNLMYDIDAWVLENALAKLATIKQRHNGATFSINLSGPTMSRKGLAEFIKTLLAQHSLDPSSLIFEITETSAIANLQTAKEIMGELKAIGCRFALDDFGTGFSSFSQLKYLPVDYIKIDGSFVQGMKDDPIDQAMVSSINDIAHSLGRMTIAEYVENPEVMRLLKDCGVDYVQGYYISEPLGDVHNIEKLQELMGDNVYDLTVFRRSVITNL